MNTRIAGILALLLVAAGCSQTPQNETAQGEALPETLKVGLIPNISPEKQKAQYEPFRAYLADRLKAGGHDAAAQAVLNGSADAAGLELRILRRLEKQGTVPQAALKIIETKEVMGYPWVAREGLSPAARDRVVAAFTGIADAQLLALMRAKSYTAVTPADYTALEEKAASLGLLTSP